MFKVGDIIKTKLQYSIGTKNYEVIAIINTDFMTIRDINGDIFSSHSGIYPNNPVPINSFELNIKEMRKQKLLKIYQ